MWHKYSSSGTHHQECHTLFYMPKASPSAEVRIGPQGRLVIPARLRRDLHLSEGDRLVARREGRARLVLEKPAAAAERLQERFAGVPQGTSLADELIAERRKEARRDFSK
jgi:AbrB family looped-hinge helix DNA binding protein